MTGRKITNTLVAAAVFALGTPAAVSAQTVEKDDVVSLNDWKYDALYSDGLSVDRMFDETNVYGPLGEQIGSVHNVLFDADGKVLSLIAEVGGFLEVADTHVNVPWDQVEFTANGIRIPITEENAEDYSMFRPDVIGKPVATGGVGAVAEDARTTAQVWRATQLIDDLARVRDGDRFANYGYVRDLIIKDGQLSAVVVSPDVGWSDGAGAPFAYPYYGTDYGWHPTMSYYNLPYGRQEVAGLEPFDYDRF